MRDKKDKGDEGEQLVALDYEQRGYTIIQRQYKIVGGEIDIIAENSNAVVFIEVKTVDNIDDLFDYISKKKIGFIKKTMQYYLLGNPTTKDIQIDIVFVKHRAILERYENIDF